jgi:PAS domain S-box-containing protein
MITVPAMSAAPGPAEEPDRVGAKPDPGLVQRPLGEIIDVDVLRTLVAGAFELTGTPAAIVDLDGKVVLKSVWQDLCARFHRSHPETSAACMESDSLPARRVPLGTTCEIRCGNGLWDVSTPLYVAGRQVGNLFVGQFFYEDEVVDLELFRARARRLGFDEEAYLEAVGRVPRWSRERVRSVMRYYEGVAGVLSAVATRTAELGRMLSEKERLVASLAESEERLRIAADAADLGTWQHDLTTGKVTADDRSREQFRIDEAEFTFDAILERVHPEDVARLREQFRRGLDPSHGDGRTSVEYRIVLPGGEVRWISVYVKVAFEGEGTSRRPVSSVGTTQDVTARRRAEDAIRSSEEQYRRLVEHLQAGIVVHGPDSRIRLLNAQACALLGLSREQALGKVTPDPEWCFLADDGRRLEAAEYPANRVIATGQAIENVVVGTHDPTSGEETWGLVTAFPEHDGCGDLAQVVVSFIDITAQRRAQAELAAVARISSLFQQGLPLPAIYSELARSLSSILRFPMAAVTLYEKETAEVVFVGVAGMAGVAPGTRIPAGETLSGIVVTTGVPRFETRASRGTGPYHESLRRLEAETFLCVPIVVGGVVAGTLALADRLSRRDAAFWLQCLDTVARELAQELGRRRAEDALRESEERLRLAADAAELGIWCNDLQTGRVRGDERARLQFGLEHHEVPFEEVLARIHPSDRPLLVGAITASISGAAREIPGDERGSLEYRVLQPNGEIRWLSVFVRIQYAGKGLERRAVAIVGTSQDITARKRAEESQLRTQKLEALGTLAGGVAHDFNNILMAIRGNAILAQGELPDGHPVRELVSEIDRAGLRAVALVRQILTFARPAESARAVVQLGPVVEEALGLLRATLPAQIAIRTTWRENLLPVAVDASQIHQVVVNLVTNAAHAIGRRPGRIDLELFVREPGEESATAVPGMGTGPYVCLSVRDDGCGMDRGTLARAFDPFFTTKRTGEGTGLGLSIVHGIIRAHGGAVDLRSQPDQGTTVTLCFPAVETPAEPAPVPQPRDCGNRTERILVVDDDEAIANLSRRSLGRLGYAVTSYANPFEAVAAFTARPLEFDAVVTDISMPGMTGFDVAEEVLAVRPGIPLVITSGYIRPEDEAAAVRLGVKALIAKPNTVDELAGVLDRIFRVESA